MAVETKYHPYRQKIWVYLQESYTKLVDYQVGYWYYNGGTDDFLTVLELRYENNGLRTGVDKEQLPHWIVLA
jgi:hypothetical protein